MIATTTRLLDEYNITFEDRSRIFVDSANPSFIRALKERLDENTNYEQQISFLKKSYPSVFDIEFLTQNRYTKLITALRTAVENGEGVLDKEVTSHDDLFDAFRMSLQFWH
jgi:hypothetical protein